MIVEVSSDLVEHVVNILNDSYRTGPSWTTEKHLVAGQRATANTITNEINKQYKYFLLKDKDQYIGCFNLRRQQNTIEIGGLGVACNRQNSGYGKYLLKKAEELSCTFHGVSRLIVSVLEPRIELIEFYKRQGYKSTSIKFPFPLDRDVGSPLVDNLQVIVLEKLLAN